MSMTKARPATATVTFVDEYAERYQDLFPDVRSFEAFKYLLVGHLSRLLPLCNHVAVRAKYATAVGATAAQSVSLVSRSISPPFALASPHEGRRIGIPALDC